MTSKPQQQQLLPSNELRKRDVDDYLGVLPAGVMPTLVEALEQGGNLLFIKKYRQMTQQISRAQDRLFKTMTAMGSHPDAPGSVTVLAVWGSAATTVREIIQYDWTGVSSKQAWTNEEYQAFIRAWFNDNRRR